MKEVSDERGWGRTGPIAHVFRGWMVRAAATLTLLVGGFVGIILYLAFWASRFTWYQNVAVVLSVVTVVPLIVVLMWLSWGLGMHRRAAEWINDLHRPE